MHALHDDSGSDDLQRPAFLHQVAALCAAPFLLERPDVDQIFPKDAIARAKKILAAFKGGVGAYTDSRGNPLVREEVANFFTKRDGVTSNPDVSTYATQIQHQQTLFLNVAFMLCVSV